MAAVVRRIPRAQQPQGVVAVGWTNPLTQNPVFLHNFEGAPLGNDATGNRYSLASGSGTPALAATPAGVGSLFQASGSNSLIFSKAVTVPAGPFTMFVYCTVNQAAMTYGGGVVLSLRGASGTPIILIAVGGNGLDGYSGAPAFLVRDDATNLVHAIGSAAVDTNPHLWVITRNAAGVITGYLDNTALPLGGGVTSSISCTAADQVYGYDPLNTSLGYLTGTVLYGGLVLNNWTAQQVAQVVANPWQLFAPTTRRFYLGSGAGSYFASWADTLTATESLAGLSAYTATVPDTLTATESLAGLSAYTATVPDTLTATEAYSDVYSGGLTPSKKSVKWASQPRSSSAADTSDPLTQGLSFLSKFGNGGYDKNGGYDNAVSGSRYYFSPSGGAPGIAVGSEGMGIASSSAAMYYQGSSALFSTTGTGDFTMLFRAVLTASAGHNPIISDVAGTQLLAVGPSGGTYDNVSTLTGPDVTVGKPFTCVWTRKAGTAYIYIDNAVTSGASSASFPSTTSTVLLGDTSTYYFTGLLYQVAIWSNRGMAPVEARQLIAAPWRLYAPLVRRFYWTPGLGTFYGTVADTPSVADALTGLSAYTGTVPDTLTLTDNTSGVPAFLASLPDTLTSTDVLNAAAAFSALVAETATITDSDSGVWGFVRSWADTPTLSDAISALGTFLATLADTLASVDVYSTGALGNLQDTLAASESLTAVGTFLAALADTPSLADLFGGASTLSAILAETLAATDAYQAAAAFLATYAESLTVTDGTFGAGSGAITDTLSAIDSYPVVVAAFKTLTDTLSASDAYYLAGLLVGNSKYVRAAAVRNYTRVGAPRNYTKIATNH